MQRFGGSNSGGLSVETDDDMLDSSVNSFDVDTPKKGEASLSSLGAEDGKKRRSAPQVEASSEDDGDDDGDDDDHSAAVQKEVTHLKKQEDDEDESSSKVGKNKVVKAEEENDDDDDGDDNSDSEEEDSDEEDKHGWERMDHNGKIYFWNWDTEQTTWKRPPDYNTDEDANPETAAEGRLSRAAKSSGSKRGEVASTKARDSKEEQIENEKKEANAFRKVLAAGITVS